MISILSILFSTFVLASPAEENLLAIGQGIASPNVTSLMNFSRGYAPENPAGVLYQGGLRASVQFNHNGDDDLGGELGYSSKTWGIAAGFLDLGCDTCDPIMSANLGFSLGKSVWMGLRYEDESIYGVGFLFNPEGKHRLGLIGEVNDFEGPNNNVMHYGVGYAYVAGKNTFAVDYSMQKFENPSSVNDVTILSPSVSHREGNMQVSLGYEIFQNEPSENNDRFWMGAGFGGRQWHLGVYANYSKEVMLTLSGFH